MKEKTKMGRAEGGNARAVTWNALMVSLADVSIYRMSLDDLHRGYVQVNQNFDRLEISPLLPTSRSPFLIYNWNSERLQNVSCDLRHLENNEVGKETLERTLGAWLTVLVKGLRVSWSGVSRMTCSLAGYGITFAL